MRDFLMSLRKSLPAKRKRFWKVGVVFGISCLVGLAAFLALLLGVATGDTARLLVAFTMVMAALVALGGILSLVVVALDAYVYEQAQQEEEEAPEPRARLRAHA